jgi:hypothetical protein
MGREEARQDRHNDGRDRMLGRSDADGTGRLAAAQERGGAISPSGMPVYPTINARVFTQLGPVADIALDQRLQSNAMRRPSAV